MRPLGRKTITVLRAATTLDPYSQTQVLDWAQPPTETLIRGCDVQQGTTQEYLLQRDQELVAWTVFAPPGIDVTTLDRVRYNGDVYTIYGHPAVWESTSGRMDYTEIVLQDWKG